MFETEAEAPSPNANPTNTSVKLEAVVMSNVTLRSVALADAVFCTPYHDTESHNT